MTIKHAPIASYPAFTKLDLSHKDYVTRLYSQFEPYSDFNFLSLFSWNIDGSTELSVLNDNLVIKLPDYLDGTPVVSILGKTNLDESISELAGSGFACKLIPETVVARLKNPSGFGIVEDEDNFDYIYDLKEQVELEGKKFSGKRKKIRSFTKKYGDTVHIREFSIQRNDKKTHELISVFESWAIHREKDHEEIKNEREAIIKFLEHSHYFNINCYEILIDGKIVGFSVNEILHNGYANCHFQKSLLRFEYMDIFFTNYVAKQLLEKGCRNINWEQDLGIPGLRHLKRSYHPVKYLKKYAIKSG